MVAVSYNFEQEQGADFTALLTIKNAEGTVIDITGYTFRGQIRQKISDSTKLADFTFAIQDASAGTVLVSLTAAQTSALPARGLIFSTLTDLVYDIEMINAENKVTRIMNGYFKVSPEVTRE